MPDSTPSIPKFPSKATEARRLRAAQARAKAQGPALTARRNAEHEAEMRAQDAERKRIRAEGVAERAAGITKPPAPRCERHGIRACYLPSCK